ncbi:MAG: NAD-dependent epimerase/dehydratase family protein [Clostridia bacterium]|nr:NAD-dependent epimerase/dehydratase family protein [Clostridia bacterium]
MKKVLVTGTLGLSKLASDRFAAESDFSASNLDLWGDSWKSADLSGYDALIHVVGVTPGSAKSDEDYENVNVKLTEELAKRAKAAGIRQFVFISSMAVYGVEQRMNASDGTVTENTPCHPTSEYGKSKLRAEEILSAMSDETFSVASIRVPSIYGKGRTEYLDQFKYLADKLPRIPDAFRGLYKSAICVDNLCELIFLIVKNGSDGVFCPDDGEISTVMFCRAIYPQKKLSRFIGKGIEILLGKNERIRDYYGAVCYSRSLADCFGGKYRVKDYKEEIAKAYEN